MADRDSLTGITGFGLAFVVLYGGMVSCYLLGRLYHHFAETLAWLEAEPEDE